MPSMSRRTFLKTSAAVATASAASRVLALGSNERIRVAVIGCRNRGWKNALSFQESGRFEIAALCDCDEKMLDVAMGKLHDTLPRTPKRVKDFRDLLSDKSIDVIINATPDHWHALITVLSLDAGKHVYLEKPASFDIHDGKAMVAAHQRHPKLVVAMGTQQRSGPHYREAKSFVESGGIGKIAFGRAWLSGGRHLVKRVPDTKPPKTLDYDMWVGPAPYRPYNEEKLHYNWHFMRDYGTNDAGNWGAHHLDIVRWFANIDLPTSAAGFGGKYINHDEKEWFDTQTALFHYPDKTVVWEMRHWTTDMQGASNGAELRGDKGTLIITRGGWRFVPRDGEPQDHPGTELMKPHVRNFADCIAGSARPAASLLEGHKTAILCHLANITATFGRSVAFDPKAETIRGDSEAQAMESREYRDKWTMTA